MAQSLNVPVINIESLLKKDVETDNYKKTINEIRQACIQWGFFYISHHGISSTLIQRFRASCQAFFSLPLNEKLSIQRHDKNSRGFYNNELTKNKVDWKQGFDFGAQNGALDKKGLDGWNQWPVENPMEFKETMYEYFHSMESLAEILMSAIASSLELSSNFFEPFFQDCHSSFLRLNYYPPCPNPKEHMAVHHHTDAGALTILLQDDHVQALEVYKNNEWHMVSPKKDTFVINIGDMIQVWSNDLYQAPLHHVQANSKHERYSAPFFYNPSYETNVEPIKTVDTSPQYQAVNWGEFRRKRFEGDYADYGEEVQISHYSLNQ